jgi:hypothetical protein
MVSSEKNSKDTPAALNISSDSPPAWYFFSQTTLVIPQLMINMAHTLQGVILQYNVLLSSEIPSLAA